MRIVFLVFAFFCFAGFSAGAQTGNGWAPGLVFLENGDSLNGIINLNRRQGLLMVMRDNTTKTFTAMQVAGFFLSDQGRAFGTFPYKEEGKFIAPAFFEIITVGRCLSLLARELDLKSDVPISPEKDPSNFYSPIRNTKQELFFMDFEGNVSRVPNKKKALMAHLPNSYILEDWLKGRRYNAGRTELLKDLVEYYNLNAKQCQAEKNP